MTSGVDKLFLKTVCVICVLHLTARYGSLGDKSAENIVFILGLRSLGALMGNTNTKATAPEGAAAEYTVIHNLISNSGRF